eukprot:gene8169-1424_t
MIIANKSWCSPHGAARYSTGKYAVPDTVDHCVVIDPRGDRIWLQATPQVDADAVHALHNVHAKSTWPWSWSWSTHENWSEAVKRLKPRILQRILDTHNHSDEQSRADDYDDGSNTDDDAWEERSPAPSHLPLAASTFLELPPDSSSCLQL